MSKKPIIDGVELGEVFEVARRFILDLGYDDCQTAGGYARPDDAEPAFFVHVKARKGPGITRKTPIEHLTVQVRLTGPQHKTLRPKLITTPSTDV